MTSSSERLARPRFTAIVPVFKVAAYIDDFLASLDRQSRGLDGIEILIVDDGSPDDSARRAEAFARSHPSATVIHQENGGLSSARNTGLEHARGEWVTFPDPDDVLADDYFEQVAAFLDARPDEHLDLLSARILMQYDADGGRIEDNHPLTHKFALGDQVVDLGIESDYFQLQAASSFLRLDRLRELGLRFDGRVRPNFEDGHLIGRYLLHSPSPRLGIIHSAEYRYRRRADESSLVQTSWSRPEKYTDLPRHGYLDLLETAQQLRGEVPAWTQNTVLYDLGWYFRQDQGTSAPTAGVPQSVLDEFHELVGRILAHIAPETIQRFSVYRFSDELRYVLTHSYRGEGSHHEDVRMGEVDVARELIQLRYRFVGPAPSEQVYASGEVAEPEFAKTRTIEYFGRTLARERILWISGKERSRLSLDGAPAHTVSRGPLTRPAIGPETVAARRQQLTRYLSAMPTRSSPDPLWLRVARRLNRYRLAASPSRLRARMLKEYLDLPEAWRRYAGAWILMDRDISAGDNAEHLYRYLAREQPQLSTWFVLRRSSPDWDRLRREGFRLVPYGSFRWHALHLFGTHFASSNADDYVVNPLRGLGLGRPGWHFTFLQHGVTKDDLSRWLNPKHFSLFVTATYDEQRSIAGDETPYVYTAKETVLTGFPRHDRLIEKRRAVPVEERRLLVVMPTWRKTIAGEPIGRGNARRKNPRFAETQYAREYSALLRSPAVTQLAAERGLEIVFMPHPNMEPYLPDFELPPTVRTARYSDTDVQQVLAQAALVVTDYSSISFDAAYIDVPVIYFQFDAESFFSGSHIGRRGYYSYERDGFGPLCTSLEELAAALDACARPGGEPAPVYRERIAATFAHRDTENSRRVYEAMSALTPRPSAEEESG